MKKERYSYKLKLQYKSLFINDFHIYFSEWNELTRGTVSKNFMPGGHFFLNDKANGKKVISFIEMKLEDEDVN